MKDHLIYLPLDGYLKDWLVNRFGVPVCFPPRSYEHAILVRHIRPRRAAEQPMLAAADRVPVAVPSIHGKAWDVYNYLGTTGQRMLTEAIENLFRLDMWHNLVPFITGKSINKRLDEWCAGCGIALERREAVRQKFFRARKDYERVGIILGRKYNKQGKS